MSKVSIIGAGNVGATAAQFISLQDTIFDEVVLLDIKEGYAEGKAMDIMQSSIATGSRAIVKGVTSDYEATRGSDFIVVTSGIPRKPGMTREELVGVNSGIVKSVLDEACKYSPGATFIIVSNPMDTMTYLAVKHLSGKVPSNRIIGMGGSLDSARFKYYISRACNVEQNRIIAYVVGGHGDKTMVPLVSSAAVLEGDGSTYRHITELIDQETIDQVVSATMTGGATLTKLLGTSAWIAPGISIAELVCGLSMEFDENKEFILSCSVYNAEYDACIGVPCRISMAGVEPFPIESLAEEDEIEKFKQSLEAVKSVNKSLEI